MSPVVSPAERRTYASIAAAFLLVWYFWGSAVMQPLWTLLLFFHETGHGIGAWVTGGKLTSFYVWFNQSGRAHLSGGDGLVYTLTGDFGSFLWGVAIILASSWTRRGRWIAAGLGLSIGGLTACYMGNLYGIVFGLAAGSTLILCAVKLSDEVNDFILKFVGASSCALAMSWIRDDFWSSKKGSSDAQSVMQMTHLPPKAWAVILLAVCASALYWTVRLAAKGARD